MIWIFLLGLGFCFLGFFFLFDFIKNKKDLYNTYLDEEGIPVSYYRQLVAAIIGIAIGLYFTLYPPKNNPPIIKPGTGTLEHQ